LRANEGRETKALNCKPYTNLKELSELSNYCKPAAFVCTLLAAVIHVMVHDKIKTQIKSTACVPLLLCFKSPNNCQIKCQKKVNANKLNFVFK
jgi:hypothetical protein